MAIDVYDCIVLYVSDAMILLMLAAGIAWSIGAIAKRTRHMIVVDATGEQLRAFIWLQLAILLATLIGFKFVVLSGGPGIDTKKILSAGAFTRTFSAISIGLAFVLALVGTWRWLMFFKQWILRHW